MKRLLKQYAPKSLYARFLLIIIVPTVLVQLIAVYMFYERHWSSMSRNMSASLSAEIALILHRLENSSDTPDTIIQEAKQFSRLKITIDEAKNLPAIPSTPKPYEVFENSLKEHINYDFVVTNTKDGEELSIHIALPESTAHIVTTQKRLYNPSTYIFIMWMVGAAIVFLIVSLLFLKNQLRSIMRLTKAAEQFGRGEEMPYFKPQGASEVRRAAVAFIEMRERIRRLISKRMQMLAAISHDMRTPLTRMRLRAELIEKNEHTEDLLGDIVEMEHMLESYLEFAQSEASTATAEMFDSVSLKDYVEGIVEGYKLHDGNVTNDLTINQTIRLRPMMMKRCLSNIIDNALHYGDAVSISADTHRGGITLYIDDNGPGLPEAEWDDVFQPFYRSDFSRNKETGGTGLGLAIARDIIHRHGGTIRLDHAPEKGLRVIINLPLGD